MTRIIGITSGKGGVGKTTCAAATAIWVANHGFKTILISSDPAHSTSDSLKQDIRGTPTPIEGVDKLWGLEIDISEEMEELTPKLP